MSHRGRSSRPKANPGSATARPPPCATCARRDRLVLATGGGASCGHANRELLRGSRVRRLADGLTRDDLGAASDRPDDRGAPPEPDRGGRHRGGAGAHRGPRAAVPRDRRFRRRRRRTVAGSGRRRYPQGMEWWAYIPVVVWCLCDLRPRPDGRVVPERPHRPAALREEHRLAVVAVLQLLQADPPHRQHPDHRLPAAARASAGTAGRSSPAATCGSNSAPGCGFLALFVMEVLAQLVHDIPALELQPSSHGCAAASPGLAMLRVPRVPAVLPDRGRGDRRRTPHHPAADPVHRGGGRDRRRGADAVAVAESPAMGIFPHRDLPAGGRGCFPNFWGKIPLGVQPWPFWGPTFAVRAARQLFNSAC